mmetsp:Transcript_15560/g.43110  ORF Transcript_15560/g.43110 Transcript_15560/m.43110 type:complete len:83 (+) Transcript_15560:372-620(+)
MVKFTYDSGDCCSDTCSHPICGIKTMDEAFGMKLDIPGNGFPQCKDPNMAPMTILIQNLTESQKQGENRLKNSTGSFTKILT